MDHRELLGDVLYAGRQPNPASRASSLRLPTPIKPMQATLMEAPVTAARISIIAAVGYFCILATLAATKLPTVAWF